MAAVTVVVLETEKQSPPEMIEVGADDKTPAADKTAPASSQLTPTDILWSAIWCVFGAVQGFVTVKCLLIYPKILADQFIFRNFVVLKMFIGAVGSSMVVQGLMSVAAPEFLAKSRVRGRKSYGFGRVIGGLAMLGAGMAIAGSGPTMLAPSLGGRVKSSWGLLIGGIVATLIVGALDALFKYKKISYYVDAKPLKKPPVGDATEGEMVPPYLVEQLLGMSYAKVSLAMGSGMIVVGILLEVFINFKDDLEKYGGPFAEEYPSNIFDYPAWPPLLAGICSGLSQLPLRMISASGLGGSGSLVTVVSTLTFNKIWPNRHIFHKPFQLVHNYVWVLMGAVIASFTLGTSKLDETSQPITDGFSVPRAAIGMFLCMFGSLFAGGCTCGHGVTGISELNVESWIGGGTIFAAAIITRCIIVFGVGEDH